MKIQFYLDSYKAKVSSKICLFITLDGKRKKLSTGLSTPVLKWDKKKENVKSDYEFSQIINNRLFDIKNYCIDNYNDSVKNGSFSIDMYLKVITNFVKGKEEKAIPSVEQKTFYERWDEFVDFNVNNHKVVPNVVLLYKRAKKYLIEFEPQLKFEMIDENFLTRYQTHLVNEKKLEINGTVPHFKNALFVFLNWAIRNEYSTNLKFKNFKVKSTIKHHNVYLNLNEIRKINELNNLHPHLDNAKTWLMIMCFTGLRVSDALTLNKSHFDFNNNTIDIVIQKTKEKVKIPIFDASKIYLEKLLRGEAHPISEQKLNEYLKELCRIAEFNNPIVYTTFTPRKIEKTVPKYTLVTNHCMRRSFATNSLALGLKAATIMKITGHKTLSSFEKYVGTTVLEAVDEVGAVWSKFQL